MKDSWEEVRRLKIRADSAREGQHNNLACALDRLALAMADRMFSRHAEPAVAIPEDPSALRPYQIEAMAHFSRRFAAIGEASNGCIQIAGRGSRAY